VYILLTDETNKQPSKKVKFFIYGGIFFKAAILPELNEKILNIRKQYCYAPGDKLKFDFKSKPSQVSSENSKKAKREILELCLTSGVKFIAYVMHHGIAKGKAYDDLIKFGVNSVVAAFDRFLRESQDFGMCAIDALPFEKGFRYISELFQHGLQLQSDRRFPLNRVVHFSQTCINAGHVNSLVDIILGAFGFCVNEREKTTTPKEMLPKIIQMMWHSREGSKINFRDKGLLIRPMDLDKYKTFKKDYDDLVFHLERLLQTS